MSIPIILWGAFAGMVLGAGLRWGSQPRSHNDLSSKPPGSESLDKTGKTLIIPTTMPVLPGPRPDVEELLTASGLELTSRMVRYLREASIDEVIGLLERMDKGEPHLYEVSWLIYRRDVIVDPERLVAWAEGHENKHLLRTVFLTWGTIDPEAALAWINEQSSSSSRDRAFQEIVRTAQGQSPEDALILAQAITDDRQRQRSVEQALKYLARQDPDKAASLLPESGLPEELVSKAEAEIAQQRIFKELSAEQ